ncbi:GTA-gp10 family protein [Mesorhizobium sp. ES1-1]|uniref:GTA-gp10 family protein n=1 Tax=Mesorhizobium sp. ES1-1 TaxID=2876629 RepID=UPI001CCFE4EA|nr:GTA-gp10 family protein [Mesorhizobium sp. ES1-1]MBZ9674554.1 GTA-gp10 family protein [Mesorhizobium sp. ES1-1]
MANTLRNEVKIILAGEERTMRATFTAIRAIEKDVGKSIMALINQLGQQGDLSVTDAAVVIHNGLRGHDDNRLTLPEVGAAILEAGLTNVSMAVVEFVSMALNGVSVGKPETAAQ